MSRYIDADKLAMHLADYQYSIPYGCIDESAEDMGAYMAVGECLKAIDEQPSIDIVRCKECKYEPICNHSVQHTTHDAYSVTIGSKTVEWCSYGEREGER